MSRYLGRITKTLEATCAGCETTVLGLPAFHAAAMVELRQDYGWGTRAGFWNCRTCKDDPEKVNRAVNRESTHVR